MLDNREAGLTAQAGGRNYTIMPFEYDPAKSESNRAKHGIDFEAAQALWRDVDHIIARAQARGEDRWILVGQIDGRLWAAFFTLREGKTRIISVRRAREYEKQQYEQA